MKFPKSARATSTRKIYVISRRKETNINVRLEPAEIKTDTRDSASVNSRFLLVLSAFIREKARFQEGSRYSKGMTLKKGKLSNFLSNLSIVDYIFLFVSFSHIVLPFVM